MLRKFNYYGNDRETYNSCFDSIRKVNRRHVLLVTIWFLLVNIFYFICAQFGWLNVDGGNRWIYANYIMVTAVFLLVVKFVPIFRKMSTVPTLLSIGIMASYAIAVSNAAPYMIAFMFPIIMFVVATSYTETMFGMIAIQVVCAAIFIFFAYDQKPMSIASQDIYNTIIVLGLSLVLHYPLHNARIHQFVVNNQNLQITRELEIQSSFDALTSLFDRKTFFSLGASALDNPTPYMALCLIDLDRFKQINDRLGHQAGDKAIQMTGALILEMLQADLADKWEYKQMARQRNISFAGRLGGDEFVILIRDRENEEEVRALMEKLLYNLNHAKYKEIHGLQASIGLTRLAEGEDIDEAYKRADEALYTSKKHGKNQISIG